MKRSFIFNSLIALALIAAQCSRREQTIATSTTAPAVTAQGITVKDGTQIEQIVINGETRSYRLHIPMNYQATKKYPLVINLHGFSANARQQETLSAMSVKADAAGFIVVYPEGTGEPQQWNFGLGENGKQDLQFFRELINALESQLSIDPKRIYVTGISNGAQMLHTIGCALSDVVAAIAPVSGGYFKAQACPITRPVPVISFHGTADSILPYEGIVPTMYPVKDWAASWAKRNGCSDTPTTIFKQGQVTGEKWGNCKNNSDVILYTIEGGGHTWPGSDVLPITITTKDINATDAIWDFFVAHTMP